MKLMELTNKNKKGTYVGMRPSEETSDRIESYIGTNQIPNGLPRDKFHTTIVYSRKNLPEFSPAGNLEMPYVGNPIRFNVWNSQKNDDGEKANCLVLEYECEEQTMRHQSIRDEHGATHDFPDYTPHITLSYDIGDMDVDHLNPADLGDIELTNEYVEDLDLDWASNNG